METLANGRKAYIVTALIGTMALLAAGCSGAAHAVGAKLKPKPTPPAAAVAIMPANGAKDVRPDNPVSVTATRGTLRSVTVKAGSDSVAGIYSAGRTSWQNTWYLAPATTYTVTAVSAGKTGKPVTTTSTFRTLTPQNTFTTQIYEAQGGTYGVGMPIILNFSQPITNKWAVERSLQLTTSTPVTGAWYWDGDQQVDFRPKDYWPAGTQVSLDAHLTGVEGAPDTYATSDLTQNFNIGDSLIAYVSPASHRAQLYKNGHEIDNWPISTGQPGDDTPAGNFLTIDKGNPVEMKPADIPKGAPGYYDVQVYWSVRFTWSGDYMHSAPWSVGQQGSSNVSHGCVNLPPSAAETYYKMEVPGDPVVVTGSPVKAAWDDGWTEWFLSWDQLVKGSATNQAVQAGPNGSQFVSP